MSYWRTEYDDGWWTFYKDGIEIKFDNPNFGDLIVDEINNANLRIAELEGRLDSLCTCEDNPSDETGRSLYIDPDCPIHGEVKNE